MNHTPQELAGKMASLHGTLEDLGRDDDDWATARHLEDALGANQHSEKDIERAKALLDKYRVLSKVSPELEWETFGSTTTGSRWFNQAPTVEWSADRRVVWKCPTKDCFGEMVQTGEVWLTGNAGYHHKCNLCGFTAAIKNAVFGQRKQSVDAGDVQTTTSFETLRAEPQPKRLVLEKTPELPVIAVTSK